MLRRARLPAALAVLALGCAASPTLADGPTTSSTTPTTTTAATSSTTSTLAATTTTAPATTTTAVKPAPLLVTTVATTTTTPTTTSASTTTTTALPPPPPAVTTSTAASTVVFSGHGWGHGVGMGQWGAYGYALHGWTYDKILAHYYPGTTLGTAPGATVRVLLADGKKRVTLQSAAPWRVVDGAGTIVSLPAGELVVPASLLVNGQQLVSPLVFEAGTSPLELGTSAYRGRMKVILVDGKLQVVNVVGVELYLQGVVPSESPSNWPIQALMAQAVAARSYALAQLTTVVTASNFDLYGDTRSQVYGGIAAETPQGDQAVQDTIHQVVLYNGAIATTYFSSSTGGRTVSAAEAFGKAVPYLVSVPDPYDTYATYHDWGPVLYDANVVAKVLGLKGQQLLDLQTAPSPSGRVGKVTAIGSESQVVVTGGQLRSALGLRSTWFTVGWLGLDPLTAPVTYGSPVTLTGIARGVDDVVLEQRPAGGTWQSVEQVVPDSSGAFSVSVDPELTTQYRLTAANLHAGLVMATVVPAVQATVATGAVQGTVQPLLAGAAIQLQVQEGKSWSTVATGTTDPTGAFTLPAQLTTGSYRIRCAPGHGLSPGVSPLLSVP
ncbi:MAG: SpoIID/LytB domain-containing protein [Actinobacteria bacterium]|nr:SpoIID/LytB domain-containing protein [Actinomycetota bacterium]